MPFLAGKRRFFNMATQQRVAMPPGMANHISIAAPSAASETQIRGARPVSFS
jgi:hypothetical protein